MVAAFDLSPLGRRVADRARLVAETLEADMTLLYVRQPISQHALPSAQQRLVYQHETKAARNVLEWISSRTDHEVHLKTPRGSPTAVVASAAWGADLLVSGSSSIDPSRLGPIPRRLARKVRADMLVVRRQPRVPYRRALAAVDLSPESAAAVRLALRLVGDGTVTVAYSIPSDYDPILADAGLFEEELEAIRRELGVTVKAALDDFVAPWNGRVATSDAYGPPAESIAELAQRRNVDLVTISSRGAGHTSLVLLGGQAEAIMEAVHCDVAVARIPGTFRRR